MQRNIIISITPRGNADRECLPQNTGGARGNKSAEDLAKIKEGFKRALEDLGTPGMEDFDTPVFAGTESPQTTTRSAGEEVGEEVA